MFEPIVLGETFWAKRAEHTQVIKTEHTVSSGKYYVIFKYYMQVAMFRCL